MQSSVPPRRLAAAAFPCRRCPPCVLNGRGLASLPWTRPLFARRLARRLARRAKRLQVAARACARGCSRYMDALPLVPSSPPPPPPPLVPSPLPRRCRPAPQQPRMASVSERHREAGEPAPPRLALSHGEECAEQQAAAGAFNSSGRGCSDKSKPDGVSLGTCCIVCTGAGEPHRRGRAPALPPCIHGRGRRRLLKPRILGHHARCRVPVWLRASARPSLSDVRGESRRRRPGAGKETWRSVGGIKRRPF